MAGDKNAAPKDAGVDELSFEAALERLETIVEQLEGGGLTLEQSIARYEEGVKLSRRLGLTLDQAEKQIERLAGDEDKPTTEPADLDLKKPAAGGEGELPF